VSKSWPHISRCTLLYHSFNRVKGQDLQAYRDNEIMTPQDDNIEIFWRRKSTTCFHSAGASINQTLQAACKGGPLYFCFQGMADCFRIWCMDKNNNRVPRRKSYHPDKLDGINWRATYHGGNCSFWHLLSKVSTQCVSTPNPEWSQWTFGRLSQSKSQIELQIKKQKRKLIN
jgi:hypothetical protein